MVRKARHVGAGRGMYLATREFGDAVAEQGEFGPNTPAAPRRILPGHLADQVAISAASFGRPTRLGLDFHRQ